jgi:predicted HicB family RNase H-like nuclease
LPPKGKSRVDIYLNEELKAQAKATAAAQGRSLNSFIEECVRRLLDEDDKPRVKRKSRPASC